MRAFVFGIAIAMWSAIVASQRNPGPFSILHYVGPSNRAVIAIYYKGNYQQPKCYGALVNFDVVVVPCSCVIKPPQNMASWWDHSIKEKVYVDDPSNFKALGMSHEYHNETVKSKLMAPVKSISVLEKCDTLFQFNVARVVLEKTIEGTKLAWVPDPSQKQMKALLQYALVGQALRGSCFVYKWTVYDGPGWGKNIPKPSLVQHEVSLTKWDTCKSLVCAKIPPKGKSKNQDSAICKNQVSGSRYCLEWQAGQSFCQVVRGTPVFCHIGRLVGLSGFIHNDTQWCPSGINLKFAVMEGLDLAFPLIQHDLRVINVMPERKKP